MRFEQMITIYGTVVVNAENIDEAKKQIESIIDGLPDNLSIEPLLIGEVEKSSAIMVG